LPAKDHQAPEQSALRASADGTSNYAGRFSEHFEAGFYRPGPGGSLVSSIGMGTYLGECDEGDDERYTSTLYRAIASGVNLLDTAINYRCQRSERAVGAAIQRAIAGGDARRESLVVCTKGGYVPLEGTPPARREEYRAYLQRAFFDTGIMTPDDVVAGGHSLAPSFLRHVIARSRQNLGVRTIDVYYLHNPEQQTAAHSPQALRERLRAAFMVLEDAVSRGEIGVYGCATWNAFRVPPGNKAHLALTDLVQLAREVAGDGHHFHAVQLPVNLAMAEAFSVPTQPVGKDGTLVPALEAAASLGLTVIASASLMQSQLTAGLPDSVRSLFPSQRTDAQRALSFTRSHPGLSSALVGMRSEEHLRENLESATK
jgi:aryl-alcohol dehydrogenase-like predicted oxidoreductase